MVVLPKDRLRRADQGERPSTWGAGKGKEKRHKNLSRGRFKRKESVHAEVEAIRPRKETTVFSSGRKKRRRVEGKMRRPGA